MWPWVTLCGCPQYEPPTHYAEKDYGIPYLSQLTPELPEPVLQVPKLQLSLGFDFPLLEAPGNLKSSKVDQVFSRLLCVTAKSPQAQGSILPSFPNFPFNWKCRYLTRSESSTERKSDFGNLFWNTGVN